MINKIKTLFQKRYDVSKVDLKTKKKNSFRSFEKDFEAREFVRKILDEKLKLQCYETKSEYTLDDDYFEKREYKLVISNCDFDEDKYIKEKAPQIFNQQLSFAINKAFKKASKQNEEKILKDIQNCEILEVNQLDEEIGFVYIKNGERKFLRIQPIYNMSSQYGIVSAFNISSKPLDARIMRSRVCVEKNKIIEEIFSQTSHSVLTDIKTIVKIFHISSSSNIYTRDDIIEIIYKNSMNNTNSYRLYFLPDEDLDIKFGISKYENIFSFKSNILDDEYKTEFDFSYDEKFFYAAMKNNRKYDDGKTYRNSYGNYPYNSCITYGKKIFFEIDKEFVKAYNLGFLHNQVIKRKYFDMLSINEKEVFKRFLSIAELYINDLEVNQKFDNEIIFDWEKDKKNYRKLGVLNKNLENSDLKKELIFYNGEQGHPSTKEVYIYSKDDKKLFYFWEIEFYGDYDFVTIKYNDDLKNEVDKFLEEK